MIESLVDIAKYLFPIVLMISGLGVILGITCIYCYIKDKDLLKNGVSGLGGNGIHRAAMTVTVMTIPYVNIIYIIIILIQVIVLVIHKILNK